MIDLDLLYDLLAGIAEDQDQRCASRKQFKRWVEKSAAYKYANSRGSEVLIRLRNKRGPYLPHNMQVLEAPAGYVPAGDGITQQTRPVVVPAPQPEAKDRGVAAKKHCTHCKQAKPLKEFYRHPETRDGRASWCKECTREKAGALRWEADGNVRWQVRDSYLTVKDDTGQRVRLKVKPTSDTLALVTKIREGFFHASDD